MTLSKVQKLVDVLLHVCYDECRFCIRCSELSAEDILQNGCPHPDASIKKDCLTAKHLKLCKSVQEEINIERFFKRHKKEPEHFTYIKGKR